MEPLRYTANSEWPVAGNATGAMPPPPPPAAKDEAPSALMEMLKSFADVATLMRMAGALTVIAAMSAFLMQDWSGGTDMERYYMLLAQTALLALGGFGLSFMMKENKGARVFFGLGLLSITANMATLGALVFSVTQWGGELANYPSYALWKADPAALGLAIAAGVVVSAPVAWFSYMVMSRRSAPVLAGLFLFANLLMVLPVRESVMAGLIAVLGIAVPLLVLRLRFKDDISLRTPEGYFAIATLFAPVLVIITRSLWLYEADTLLHAVLALMVFALLRVATPLTDAKSKSRGLLEWGGLCAAMFTAYPLAISISPYADTQAFYTVFSLVFGGMMLDIARRSEARRKGFVFIGAGMLALLHGMALIEIGTTLSAVLCMAAGVAVFMAGKATEQRPLLVLGAVTVLAGLVQQVHTIITQVDFSNWAVLAALGVSIIVLASVVERYGAVLRLKWQRLGNTHQEDEAT